MSYSINFSGRGQSSRSSPGTSTPSSGKSSNKVDNHDLGKFVSDLTDFTNDFFHMILL